MDSHEPVSAVHDLARLRNARILFVHQSVGENVVSGIESLQRGSAEQVSLIDPNAARSASGGYFAHARLGRNGDPQGKTDAFVAALEEGGLGNRVDIAFQKYCFADFDERTDAKAIFAHYQQGIGRIHREFPNLKIVHVTVPLLVVQSGPKAIIKRLIGRVPDHYEDNLVREQFSDLLRREYKGREPIFDLAALEGRQRDGSRESISFGDAKVYSLLPEYASDSGHLNEPAQRRIARELLSFLSKVLQRPAHTATATSE